MTEAKHTKLPWFVGEIDEPISDVPAIEIDNDKCSTKDWKSIAWVNSSLQGEKFKLTKTDRANAAFIVRACNSFYKVIDILHKCSSVADEKLRKEINETLLQMQGGQNA